MNRVDNYFGKLESPQKEICLKLRTVLSTHLPDLCEEFNWGVPVYAGGKIYIVALQDHVNLGFALKDLPAEKQALLKGSGKTMKHLSFYSLDEIDEKIILGLIHALQ